MLVQVFLVGLIFSFIGSIPPGTLNILVLQLGLEKRIKAALRFALAVSIVEYPYAWIAVVFEDWITSSPSITQNFQLTGAIVMTAIGVINLWSARKPSRFSVKFQESGFRRGLVLSVLNPQAIPFWVAVTAYLKIQVDRPQFTMVDPQLCIWNICGRDDTAYDSCNSISESLRGISAKQAYSKDTRRYSVATWYCWFDQIFQLKSALCDLYHRIVTYLFALYGQVEWSVQTFCDRCH